MSAKQQLAAWLYTKNKDYHHGLTLMKSLGIGVENPKFFDVPKPSKIHQSLLLRQLSEYARINGIKPAAIRANQLAVKPVVITNKVDTRVKHVPANSSNKRPRVDKNPVVRYEELPANLQVLFDENGKIQGEIKSLHAKLKLLKDDPGVKAERGELAIQIVSRQKKNRSNWDAIDSWWAGQDTEEDPIEKVRREVLEQDKRIKANLNYIRRYHGKEKNIGEVNIRMQELDKWGVSYEKLIR